MYKTAYLAAPSPREWRAQSRDLRPCGPKRASADGRAGKQRNCLAFALASLLAFDAIAVGATERLPAPPAPSGSMPAGKEEIGPDLRQEFERFLAERSRGAARPDAAASPAEPASDPSDIDLTMRGAFERFFADRNRAAESKLRNTIAVF